MSKYKRCNVCVGSGRVLGGGMMQVDCEECDGRGKIKEVEDDIDYLSKKQSYDQAKERLQDEANLTEEEAKKYLDAELKKKKKRAIQ